MYPILNSVSANHVCRAVKSSKEPGSKDFAFGYLYNTCLRE